MLPSGFEFLGVALTKLAGLPRMVGRPTFERFAWSEVTSPFIDLGTPGVYTDRKRPLDEHTVPVLGRDRIRHGLDPDDAPSAAARIGQR